MNIPEPCPFCGIAVTPKRDGGMDGYWHGYSECPLSEGWYYRLNWNRRQPTPEAEQESGIQKALAAIKWAHNDMQYCAPEMAAHKYGLWSQKLREALDQLEMARFVESLDEPFGSSVCPICGKDAPHYHAPDVVTAHYSGAVKSASLNQNPAHPPKPEPTEAVAYRIEEDGTWLYADGAPSQDRLERARYEGQAVQLLCLAPTAPKPPAEWMEAAAKEIFKQRIYANNNEAFCGPDEIVTIIKQHYSAGDKT